MQSIHPLTIGIPGKRALAALATVALTASAQAQFEARNEGVFRDRVDWGVMMDLSGR